MLEDFYHTLDQDPADWPTRQILADWYEDAGNQGYAKGARWQVHYKRHVRYGEGTFGIMGLCRWSSYPKGRGDSRKPDHVEIGHHPPEHEHFESQLEADQWLADRLKELSDAGEPVFDFLEAAHQSKDSDNETGTSLR